MRSFGQSTALARRTCLSFGTLNFGESKNLGSGQKRTVVPVLRWPTVPTTLRPDRFCPLAKDMWCSLPSRLTHTSSFRSEERRVGKECRSRYTAAAEGQHK